MALEAQDLHLEKWAILQPPSILQHKHMQQSAWNSSCFGLGFSLTTTPFSLLVSFILFYLTE